MIRGHRPSPGFAHAVFNLEHGMESTADRLRPEDDELVRSEPIGIAAPLARGTVGLDLGAERRRLSVELGRKIAFLVPQVEDHPPLRAPRAIPPYNPDPILST